jgi:hypothetical protein
MPDQTPRGYPYPLDNSDPPDGGAQIQALAIAIDSDVEAIDARTIGTPSWDTSNSVYLTATPGSDPASPDKRLTQSATTDILTASFTLSHDQAVLVGAKALLVNTGSATGATGICISLDGSMIPGHGQVGAVELGATGTSTDQINTAIPTFSVSLAAGSHTVILQADRDANGVINARSSTTPNGRTYHPTSLTIIV